METGYVKNNDLDNIYSSSIVDSSLKNISEEIRMKSAISRSKFPLIDKIQTVEIEMISPNKNTSMDEQISNSRQKIRLPPTFQAINLLHKEQVVKQIKLKKDNSSGN